MREELLSAVREHQIIAIVRSVRAFQAEALAQALYDGGIRLMELPFDQRAQDHTETLEAIRRIRRSFEGRMFIGAGTVMTVSQVSEAAEAGAQFIVSPNTDEAVIRRTRELGLVSAPGALTPTEIAAAWAAGADLVKVFPVSAMPLSYLKEVRAPLSHIPLLAVGGVSPDNAADYLRAGAVGIGVGSTLVPQAALQAQDYAAITASALRFSGL